MNTKVRSYLIELARKRANQTVTYQVLCDDCKLGLDMSQINDRDTISKILGDISTYEFNNKRPLLSSLVIKKGQEDEGEGFYRLAEKLGFGNHTILKKRGVFAAKQIKETIKKWSNDKFYNQHK